METQLNLHYDCYSKLFDELDQYSNYLSLTAKAD